MDRKAHIVNSAAERKPLFFWLALVLSVLMLLHLAVSVGLIKRYWNTAKGFELNWVVRGDSWFAPREKTEEPFAGGDRLISINGDKTASYRGFVPWYRAARIGDLLVFSVERDGRVLTIESKVEAKSLSVLEVSEQMLKSLALLAMAALMGLMRPNFPTARLGFWAGLIGSYLFSYATVSNVETSLQSWERFVYLIPYQPLQFAIGYHFLSQFPSPVIESLRWRALRVFLYFVAIWVWTPRAIWSVVTDLGLNLRRSEIFQPAGLLHFYDTTFPLITSSLHLFAGVAMLAVVARNYRLIKDAVDRRRMRFGAIGAIPTLIMLLVLGLIRTFSNVTGIPISVYALRHFSSFLVILAPITLAYAVLKHRLMGIRFVIRRGVQYLLAQNVLRVILFLPVLLIVWEMITHPDRSLAELVHQQSVTFDILIFALAAFSLRYRKSMQEWMDRRFFRTAYSQERILLELLDDVKSADSLQEISQLVASKIEAALHPKDLYIFYRKDVSSEFTLGYPEDIRAHQALDMLRQREILDTLESGMNAPVMISTMGGANEPIDFAQSSLLVPLTGANQALAGVLWLDEKKSEEPYSSRDRDLLQAIAGQIAMVYENLHLREKLEEEVRVRINVIGRLDRESINLLKECPTCGHCYDRTVDHCTVDGGELTMNTPVERVIEKKYRLDRRLGTGGMGSVYEANDLRLNRKVAIKVMVGRLFGNRAALRRFEREARASARLRHPNIVTIHDFGRLEGEGAYLVMEYIEGISWRSELSNRRAIPPREAVPLFDQLSRAMIAAHEAGIIHRDVKPENLILTKTPDDKQHVTVLDFGLAKVREMELGEANHSAITATGVVMGTLRYMSPEQLAGNDVDTRSDVYSMGLILLETLFGGFPTKMRDLHPWLDNALRLEADRNPMWNPDYLREVLKKVLARDREARYPTVAEFHAQLIPVLKRCPEFGPVPGVTVETSATRTLGE